MNIVRNLAALALAWLLLSPAADAQPCFSPAQGVPGLPGAPNWSQPGSPIRSERDEPRWAPAPVQAFSNDVFGSLDGGYRLLYDAAAQELVIAVQMFSDFGTGPSEFDSMYLGLTTDITGTTAEGVRIALQAPTGAPDPVALGGAALSYNHYQFTGGAWAQPGGPFPSGTAPSWLAVSHAWLGGGVEWAVHVKVDLAALGLAPGSPFRFALGIHSSDDVGSAAIDLTTPDVGIAGSVGSLFTMNPAGWMASGGADTGCPSGITLSSMAIGTTNPDPHRIATDVGHTNTFSAAPSVPAGMVTGPNVFQAKFRIANWGIIASPTAGWSDIPGAGSVANGTGSAPDSDTVHFTCPANTASQVCGMAPPAEPHQCVLVELSKVPTSPASPVFTKAAAYRNMRFAPLSEFTDKAVIDMAGLEKITGNQDGRTAYLHIKRSNMPSHGNDPLWLRPAAMSVVRRMTENPGFALRSAEDEKALSEAFGLDPKGTQGQGISVSQDMRRGLIASNGQVEVPRTAPYLRGRPWQLWGLTDHALLTKLWPTYEVHGYYEVGTRKRADGSEYMRMQPMVPFVYFFEHDGPLYGFSDKLEGAGFEEVRGDLFRLHLPNEGKATAALRVSAEEAPRDQTTEAQCPDCKPLVVDGCGRCAVGARDNSGLNTALGITGLLGLLAWRRRRKASRG